MDAGKRSVVLGLAIASLTACATIMHGTDQPFTVVTEQDVAGANCKLTDVAGGEWYVSVTPGTTVVGRGDGPMTVECSKEGFKTTTIQVEEKLDGMFFGNFLFGGLIGMVIDASNGAAQQYPPRAVLWMEPNEWESEEAKAQWFETRARFEAELQTFEEPESSQQESSDDYLE